MAAKVRSIRSPATYPDYLRVDDCQKTADRGRPAESIWMGMGARAMGLEGTVDCDELREVLKGRVPESPQKRNRKRATGKRLGRARGGGVVERRLGLDLTLSAPKSVSVIALVGPDFRILDAHDRAVRAALAFVESKLVETRIWDPIKRTSIRVGRQRFLAATFRHTLSRTGDPQLHTHCAIPNTVVDADGNWRSMANEKIYNQQKRIDATYLEALATEVERLGYRIVTPHSDGRFEIKDVPREVIDAFSTRRDQIKAETARNASCGRAIPADKVAQSTRTRKRSMDRVEREREWRERASNLGFSAAEVVQTARQSGHDRSGEHSSANPGGLRRTACRALAAVVGGADPRKAVSRSLHSAPALRARPNVLTHGVFLAGSELAATSGLTENTCQEVIPHIVFSPPVVNRPRFSGDCFA